MDAKDIKLYTRYNVAFFRPQHLRCFPGKDNQFLVAELVFFRPALYGSSLLYYKRPNGSWGYPIDPRMAENMKSIEEVE